MLELNKEIVARYFELKGYSVNRSLFADLAIENPKTGDRAVVGIKGWHAEVFYLGNFTKNSEIFDFIKPEILRTAGEFFNSNKFRKILVVSRISRKQKNSCIEACGGKGVDELIEFRAILDFLINNADESKNYSDPVMQMARLFRVYYTKDKLPQRLIREYI